MIHGADCLRPGLSGWPERKRITQGAILTGIKAAETTNALRTIGIGGRINFNRTNLLTIQTVKAACFIHDHLKKAEAIKEAPEGSEGAGCPAESPIDEKHQGNKNQEKGHLPGKHEANLRPETRIKGNEGKSGFQGSSRTDPFAEPGLAKAEFINNQKRQENDQKEENNETKIGEKMGQPDSGPLFLMNQFLKKTEGTEPATGEATCEAAHNG